MKASTPENAIRLPSVVPSAETSRSEMERQEREAISDMFSPSSPPHEEEPVHDNLKSKDVVRSTTTVSHSKSHGKSIEQIMQSKEDSDAASQGRFTD